MTGWLLETRMAAMMVAVRDVRSVDVMAAQMVF
jgi:hypothetical protein